ncbi:MAG: hypothetical protein ACLR7U_01650 [Ruthenibacterium lactatiformans]
MCAYIPGGGSAEGKAGVLVYEAQTNRDMAQIADRLAPERDRLLAGCGLCIRVAAAVALSCRDTRVAVLRPSARGLRHQPGPLEQCAQAEAQEPRFSLTPEQKLADWAPARRRRNGAVLRPVRRSRWWCWTQAARWRTRRGQNRRPHPDRQYAVCVASGGLLDDG